MNRSKRQISVIIKHLNANKYESKNLILLQLRFVCECVSVHVCVRHYQFIIDFIYKNEFQH